jgi:hypothetical protein
MDLKQSPSKSPDWMSNNRGEQHLPVNVGMHFPGAQNVLLNYLVIDSSR